MAKEKIDTYPEAARAIHVWLLEFCDSSRPWPDMIAEAARRAMKEIERLRHLSQIKSNQKEIPNEPYRITWKHEVEFEATDNRAAREFWKELDLGHLDCNGNGALGHSFVELTSFECISDDYQKIRRSY
ncbi:unnamed protein product [marine sediment metagenome]|uniref:Uncharacterized protein n=1 Tax=marine sediment metagenome TaxID=412755 RepID=X1CYP8_9ZZZZ